MDALTQWSTLSPEVGDVQIPDMIHRALIRNDEDLMNALLDLRAENAQRILGYMQRKLQDTAPYRAQQHEGDMSTYRSRFRSFMMRLAKISGELPRALFLEGVQLETAEPIAHGSFSDIFKGNLGKTAVAVKRLRLFTDTINDTKAALLRETLLWRNLEHRHILSFLGIECNTFTAGVCMVLPWMPHGSARKFSQVLLESQYPMDLLRKQVDDWFEQIARGLAYLHSEEIVHGDLRGANVLVDGNWEAKLADFGLSVIAEAGSTSASLRGGGIPWLAPELHELTGSRPTYASDIYSLAHVSIELYTGKAPYAGKPMFQVLSAVMRGERLPKPSFYDGQLMAKSLWSVVTRCWDQQPAKRPSAEQVVGLLADLPKPTAPRQLKRSTTAGQCVFPDCPLPVNQRIGTGFYCSKQHEALALARTGCINCRLRFVSADDLCARCRVDAEGVTPALLQVPYDHDLFDIVMNKFCDTWGRTGKACPSVRHVYKILSSSDVMKRYEAYRSDVEHRGRFISKGKLAGNETDGWHGTRRACQLGNDGRTDFCSIPACSLCSIVKTSFDIGYGATALGFGLGWEILGKGIYTSSSSSKSDKYAYNTSWNTPLKAMLLNKVVMGKCYVVDKTDSMLSGLPEGYDSARLPQAVTVDDIAVYRNDAILPAFVVMYDGN